MNWVKENRFLAGLLGVTVVGAGALGYLLMTAKTRADESTQNYETQAQELNRLQHLPAYPDQQNLAKLQAQHDEHVALLDKLQRDLAAIKEPVEPLDPRAFQDHLRESVTKFLKDAEGKMGVPQKGAFYLGFDRYQSAPPTPEAAPLLGRQLKAVEAVLYTLLSSRVTELKKFDREELPEEGGKSSKNSSEAQKTPAGGGKKGRASDKDLVRKHSMDLIIAADQSSFQSVLNQLATSSKNNFFITRYVSVVNSNPKGPAKGDTADASQTPGFGTPAVAAVPAVAAPAAGATTPAAAATPAAGGEEPLPKIIAGEETVESTLRVEVVDFAEPPAAEAPKGKRNASN